MNKWRDCLRRLQIHFALAAASKEACSCPLKRRVLYLLARRVNPAWRWELVVRAHLAVRADSSWNDRTSHFIWNCFEIQWLSKNGSFPYWVRPPEFSRSLGPACPSCCCWSRAVLGTSEPPVGVERNVLNLSQCRERSVRLNQFYELLSSIHISYRMLMRFFPKFGLCSKRTREQPMLEWCNPSNELFNFLK